MRVLRRVASRATAAVVFGSLASALVIGVAPVAAQDESPAQVDVCSGNSFVPDVPIPGFDTSDQRSVLVRAFIVRGCDVDDVTLVVTYPNGLTWLQSGNDIRLSDAPACSSEDTGSFCTGATDSPE